LRAGTGEMSRATDDLAQRTQRQAASLEETAAALDEITVTVTRTADGADHARGIASVATTETENGSAIVRRAVGAMEQIKHSAREIRQIIGVIDEIAFQTNLLALNAGVEAARAGEAGRGFAVVASEVRSLAQRCAEAARNVNGLITNSTSQVNEGVTLVSCAGEALERIMVQVSDINRVVAGIAESAREQSIGLQQVNKAVNDMDHLTQQNAAMAEESTAAVRSLADKAEELAELVGHFSVASESSDAVGHATTTSGTRRRLALIA
jgi:methyl-accepting chemotaxis protein